MIKNERSIRNLYCEGSFGKKVEASLKFNEMGIKARTIAWVVFKKNSKLYRPTIYVDEFSHNDEILYVVNDNRYNEEGDRKIIGSFTQAVKYFVKKSQLKSASQFSIEDETFKKEVFKHI